MIKYLIRTADPSQYTDAGNHSALIVGKIETDSIVLVLSDKDLFPEFIEDPELPVEPPIPLEGEVIWVGSPELQIPVQAVASDYSDIRPLGNEPARPIYDEDGNQTGETRGGNATKNLAYVDYDLAAGQARLTPEGDLYPPSNSPVGIEIRHKYFDGNDNPAWDGYGWRAEVFYGATSRDITSRAIGIYVDAECTEYWYTTGAFTLQASEWQVDAEGNPAQVYATEYNPAFLTGEGEPEPTVQHHALLLGSKQEGYETLRADEDADRYLFWEHTQGEEPPAGTAWVDTGGKISALAGQLYRIDSQAAVDSLTPGQAIRLGDTAETTFTGVWDGGTDYIEIDPYVSAEVGDTLWKWE